MDQPLRENQALWDAWTRIHVPSEFYDVASFRDGRDPIRLADYEREEIGPVEGRSLLHLQCHFGLDTLSWARLGAVVTGLDFSAEAVAAARSLASEVGLPATFVQSNLYDAPEALDGPFDIVYTSRGVLGWLPDIEGWARVVAHFVRPGGTFYVTEVHPIAQVFADEGVVPGELRLRYPYWSHPEPISGDVVGSYADPSAPTDGLREHGWDHSLGEIVSALVAAGLRIDFLHEFPFVEWPVAFLEAGADGRYRLPADAGGELPFFFSLRATKPADADQADRLRTATAVLAQLLETGEAAQARLEDARRDRSTAESSVSSLDGLARETLREAEAGRTEVAHELHDTAAQAMVSAHRFLEVTEAALEHDRPDQAGAYLRAAHGSLMTAIGDVRRVLNTLVPPGLEELGVAHALEIHLRDRVPAGIATSVSGRLPRAEHWLEAGLFAMAAEAVANAVIHGRPTAIAIALSASSGRGIITVSDDGVGFDPIEAPRQTETGMGLVGMRRRASWIGGAVDIASVLGEGTTVRISVPLDPAGSAADADRDAARGPSAP